MKKQDIKALRGDQFYKSLIARVINRFNVSQQVAEDALEIACNFNIRDEEELFMVYMPIIIATIRKVKE